MIAQGYGNTRLNYRPELGTVSPEPPASPNYRPESSAVPEPGLRDAVSGLVKIIQALNGPFMLINGAEASP